MRSRILAGLLTAVALVMPFASHAEVITSFDVTATVSADRTVVFEEEIRYDFESLDRHGIYRFIPEKTYRDGANYSYRYNVKEVTRDGKKEPFEASHWGGQLRLKIGDADTTITGPHTYRIVYETDRAITFFDDHDELYWNVTGNEWEVEIEKASMKVILPDGATVASSTCFTGAMGSTEQDCSMTAPAQSVEVNSKRVLLVGEGMTAAFWLPKGIVTAPTGWDRFWMLAFDNGVLFFPLAALLIMGSRWWVKGRDPKLQSIIAQYEPPRLLRPAIMAAAVREDGVPKEAITATIIDLARRGFLHVKIEDEKKFWGSSLKYTFIKKKELEGSGMREHEKTIFNGLFRGGDEQTIEDLKKHEFYEAVSGMRSEVGKEITAMKLFDANPGVIRGAYLAVGIVIAGVLGIFFAGEPLGFIAVMITGIIIAVFGWFMPRRTAEGRKMLEEILGFKLFLSVTEKDRMSFHNAPERKPEQFQEFLPYAIIFGVEKQWAEQFKDLHLDPPEWVEGNASSNFGIDSIAHSISAMSSAASSSAYSAPSSGGSGFSGGGSSGGGGGGGGGGSW